MSYDIFGEHGYVDGGPTISGLRAFRAEVSRRANRGRFPQLEIFLEHGLSTKPRLLARECRVLAATIKNRRCPVYLRSTSQGRDAFWDDSDTERWC